MLNSEIDRVKVQDEVMTCSTVVSPNDINMNEERAQMSITKAKLILEDFYRNLNPNFIDGKKSKDQRFNQINSSFILSEDNKSEVKSELFSSLRQTMQSEPNLIIYRTIHKSITNDLEAMLHHRDTGTSLNKSMGVEETIQRSLSEAYQRFLMRSTQLDAEREALHTITGNYEQLYTEMNDSLVHRMPDSRNKLREEFITESSHLFLNEGRIQLLHQEIERNKLVVKERTEKMREIMAAQDTVQEVVRKCKAGLALMVGEMKQMRKISSQLGNMRDLTESHVALMRGDFKPGTKRVNNSTGKKSWGTM